MRRFAWLSAVAVLALARASLGDQVVLGNDSSERGHALVAEFSEVMTGALGQRARTLLPRGGTEGDWEGGKVTFRVAVDPAKQNYVTAKFWGGAVDPDYLILFCEGKQVGYRHLGDVEVLGLSDEEPRYNGRFYYVTTPLPLKMTTGKTEVQLAIQGTGAIWGYGATFAQYQKSMTAATRGIYRIYVGTDACFVPAADDVQGEAPRSTPGTEPGAEVLDALKGRVNGALVGFMKSKTPRNQMELQFLAKAYHVEWTAAHHSATVVEQVVRGVDALYEKWKKDPNAVWQDKATWNPGWFGVGPAGDAVKWLAKEVAPSLDEKLDGEKTRRECWSELFQASRDWLRLNRRWLTNQAMFTDTNLYLSDAAVRAIDPPRALPPEKALDYLYQATGIVPWLGAETENGPEKLFGSHFYQVTRKGLTRERGYVGGYGEGGVEGAMDCFDATRGPDSSGDEKLKDQLLKMMHARAYFRYPMLDEENHPAMRLETAIGWRDTHNPGEVMYAQRAGGERSVLRGAAETLDPTEIGYVQQMFSENQYFAALAQQVKDNKFRAMVGLLEQPDEYAKLNALPAMGKRLPMSTGEPDCVFADEGDGVVAIKNGQEILYASLYWRAGFGINALAHVHLLTPQYSQVATVSEEVQYTPSGKTYKRPDWINFGFANGGLKYPGDVHQALAGEELPIAAYPADAKVKPGDESHFAGFADFYVLRFGRYVIAMNTTEGKTFEFDVPGDGWRNLVSKKNVSTATLKVGALATVVLWRE